MSSPSPPPPDEEQDDEAEAPLFEMSEDVKPHQRQSYANENRWLQPCPLVVRYRGDPQHSLRCGTVVVRLGSDDPLGELLPDQSSLAGLALSVPLERPSIEVTDAATAGAAGGGGGGGGEEEDDEEDEEDDDDDARREGERGAVGEEKREGPWQAMFVLKVTRATRSVKVRLCFDVSYWMVGDEPGTPARTARVVSGAFKVDSNRSRAGPEGRRPRLDTVGDCQDGSVGTLLIRGNRFSTKERVKVAAGETLVVVLESSRTELKCLLPMSEDGKVLGEGQLVEFKVGNLTTGLDNNPVIVWCRERVKYVYRRPAFIELKPLSSVVVGTGACAGSFASPPGPQQPQQQQLQQQAGVDAIENTPLIIASAAGDAVEVERLLEAGAVVDQRNRVGDTAMLYACGNGHSEVVGVLLRAGAEPSLANDDGETPLHHACAAGDLPSVRALVASGADINAKSAGGLSPLHDAVWRRHTDVVSHLLSVGANPNEATSDGLTALHLACAAAPPSRKAASAELLGILMRYQADVRARERIGGLLPALYLVQSASAADVEVMLRACHAAQELSGPLIPTDDHGMSLLHHAAMTGCHQSLELLLSWPFELWPHVLVGLQDRLGRTALHLAAVGKDLYSVRLLVERGRASLDVRDSRGQSPVDCANDPQIFQYLTQAASLVKPAK